jgi:N-acyl homoserine lactone hydrolase
LQKKDQLAKLNIKPGQVAKVILTHLHGDNTDGLKFFPANEIFVLEAEHQYPCGNLPTTYPKWFKPTLINFSKDRVECFDEAHAITTSEDFWLVPTPGHTRHHCSILFKTDNEHILIAGDASYTQQQLTDNIFAGTNIDYKKLKGHIQQEESMHQNFQQFICHHPIKIQARGYLIKQHFDKG